MIYANGGGAGLVESEYKAAAKHGVTVRYGARATGLLAGNSGVEGLRVSVGGAGSMRRDKCGVSVPCRIAFRLIAHCCPRNPGFGSALIYVS